MESFITILIISTTVGFVAWFSKKILLIKAKFDEMENLFLTTMFSMLGSLAKADGEITPATLKVVENYLTDELKLDAERRARAITLFKQANSSTVSFEADAQKFYNAFQEVKAVPLHLVELLLRVASADGHCSANKEKMILSAVKIFNIDSDTYDQIRGYYLPADNSKYYAILKCQPEDSVEEIKAKYRRLAMDYHPDRIQSKGLPEDFMKFANQKFQEIQKAYQLVRKERGF
jgi:DnaJ like chaperone protein